MKQNIAHKLDSFIQAYTHGAIVCPSQQGITWNASIVITFC